jgi:glycerophosphoryl diester phosphodiesterase
MNKLFLALVVSISSPTYGNTPFIVAHRGASHDAPENTLAAFRLAWEKQSDAIEGDFYVTKDNQIVCIHDKTTKRVAPHQPERMVAESTLQELRQLDVGSWKHERYAGERIPTLRDVLSTVPAEKRIFVEVKCGPEILPLLEPELAASGLKPTQIVIICFDEEVVSQARKTMPQYKANWLTSYKQNTGVWRPSREEVLRSLAITRATGLGTKGNLDVIDVGFAGAVRDAGSELHVWTVNDPDEARKFADLGATSITTDRPALIRNAIRPTSAGNR